MLMKIDFEIEKFLFINSFIFFSSQLTKNHETNFFTGWSQKGLIWRNKMNACGICKTLYPNLDLNSDILCLECQKCFDNISVLDIAGGSNN